MNKIYKHKTLNWIAKGYNAMEYQIVHNQTNNHLVPKELIENSADWELIEEKKEYPRSLSDQKVNLFEFKHSIEYGKKLRLLDILLCLRDDWNGIDGFVPDFKNGWEITKHCIVCDEGVLILSVFCSFSQPFAFSTKETASLFLETFRKELEEVKEFL